MKRSGISFITVISIIGAYAAYGIGSGFATGQEILQYFASWGPHRMVIALASSALLMGIAFSSLVRTGFSHKDDPAGDFDCFIWYGGKYFGKAIDVFSIILVMSVFIAVFAGCGATVHQYFHVPALVGTVIMGAIVAVVVMMGLKRIVQILSCLGVIFIVYTVCFGTYCMLKSGQSLTEASARMPEYIEAGKVLQVSILGISDPFWAGLNYGGVNLIVAVPFVTALGQKTKNNAEASIGGAGAGVVFMVPVLFSAITILLNLDYIALYGEQVPSLAAVTNMLPSISWLYLIILVLGIFSTLTGYTWLITDRYTEEGSRNNRILCVVVVLAGIIAGGYLPFNVVLNKIFPVAGLVGMLLTVLIIIKDVRVWSSRQKN